ncbi:MAG: hypothetical protein AAF307_05155 [Pseudomonadota bacterium]
MESTTHTSAQQGSVHGLAPTDWGMHMIRRSGAPPLRFSGRRISHHTLRAGIGQSYISLWEMRRRGYVLEHSIPTQGNGVSAVLSVPSVADAVAALDAFCDELSNGPEDTAAESGGARSAMHAIFEAQVRVSRVQSFLTIAGAALAQWDRCQTPIHQT